MFTTKADALSAILDKVVPHRPGRHGLDHLDMIVLDCTRGWLHAVAAGERTIAVARTPVETAAHWTAPVAYDDVYALSAWLESSDQVHVEHTLDSGRPLLHFTEGAAQTTVPVASYMADLPWRKLLRLETRPAPSARLAVRISAEDLALWEHAGENVEIWPAAGVAAFVVTAGPNFIGFHLPHFTSPDARVLEGWRASLRSRRFLHDGTPYEIGASYADQWGTVWRVTARPEPGEMPMVVSADSSAVALPLAVVLRVGGRLKRISA